MGFVATEQVEEMSYDFNPYVEAKGTIPEPTSARVDAFRKAVFAAAQSLGLSPEQMESGQIGFEQMADLMDKAGEVERGLLAAVADLTMLPLDTLDQLPYRLKAAFSGWLVGMFARPEA